jgi:hypothetical protein
MVTRDPLPRIQTFGMTPSGSCLGWTPARTVRSQRARVRNAGRDGNGVVESDDGGREPGLEGPSPTPPRILRPQQRTLTPSMMAQV